MAADKGKRGTQLKREGADMVNDSGRETKGDIWIQ